MSRFTMHTNLAQMRPEKIPLFSHWIRYWGRWSVCLFHPYINWPQSLGTKLWLFPSSLEILQTEGPLSFSPSVQDGAAKTSSSRSVLACYLLTYLSFLQNLKFSVPLWIYLLSTFYNRVYKMSSSSSLFSPPPLELRLFWQRGQSRISYELCLQWLIWEPWSVQLPLPCWAFFLAPFWQLDVTDFDHTVCELLVVPSMQLKKRKEWDET